MSVAEQEWIVIQPEEAKDDPRWARPWRTGVYTVYFTGTDGRPCGRQCLAQGDQRDSVDSGGGLTNNYLCWCCWCWCRCGRG